VSPAIDAASVTSDKDLARAVQLLVRSHPAFFGQRISAAADDGVVVLTGIVDSTAYARAARNGARLIPGVRSVVDELQLRARRGPSPALRARHEHAGVAASVRTTSNPSRKEGNGHEGSRLSRTRRESVGGRT
jgi:cation diffusion facilitator CzcD-associated flavoprotein CzcO